MNSTTRVSHSPSHDAQLPLLPESPALKEMWSSFGDVGVQVAQATAQLSKVWMDTSIELQSGLLRLVGDQARVLDPGDLERAAWPGAGD